MIGNWSPKGYLLLRHVLQRTDHRKPTLAWAAEMLDTSEFQLRKIIHRDNKMNGWFWRFIQILEDKGWPVFVLFEYGNQMNYDAIEPLPFDMEVEWKAKDRVLTWRSQSRYVKSHGKG